MVNMNNCNGQDLQGVSFDGGAEIVSSKETMDILVELSSLLKTRLDLETLAISQRLIENGVNPQILATVITKMRKEASDFKKATNGDNFY